MTVADLAEDLSVAVSASDHVVVQSPRGEYAVSPCLHLAKHHTVLYSLRIHLLVRVERKRGA